MKKTQPEVVRGNTDPNYSKTINTSKQYRLFCFTHFDNHHNLPNLVGNWRYIVGGREICPETKNHHFQCFVYFNQKLSLSKFIKLITLHLGKHPKCFGCSGSLNDNFNYCTKDGDYYEWGDKPKQGSRSDLNLLKDELLSGNIDCEEIRAIDPFIYHQYGRTLDKLEDDYNRKKFRTEQTTCEWIYGKTGVGKSHYAFKDYNPKTHYLVNDDNGWWDGYKGQDVVIINEFRGEIKFKMLLELCDKYPYNVKRRCRQPMPFTSKHIIITSCDAPEEIYNKVLSNNDSIDQLYRRIKVREMKGILSIP